MPKLKKLSIGCATLAIVLALGVGVNYLIMLAWNYVLAGVFGLPVLGFWHVVALSFLVAVVVSTLRGVVRRQ